MSGPLRGMWSQDDLCKTLTCPLINCLSVLRTIRGSVDSSCIRICTLGLCKPVEGGHFIDLFSPGLRAGCVRTFSFRVTCPSPRNVNSWQGFERTPKSFRILATASLADRVFKFYLNTLLTEGFARVNDFPDLEFPWRKALMECSSPSNWYCNSTKLFTIPPHLSLSYSYSYSRIK